MKKGKVILVLNLDKNRIKNYIGAHTVLEMVFVLVLNQKIFLYNNPIEMDYVENHTL